MAIKQRPRNLDDFDALDYSVRMWRRQNGFTMAIEELSLVATASTLEDAWRELDRRKREYFATMIDVGRANAIAFPAEQAGTRDFWRAAGPFAFKTIFAAFIVLLVGLSIVPAIKYQTRDLGREVRSAGRELPNGVFEGLADFDDLEPDRQERAVAGVRRLLTSLEPVIAEIQRILAEQERTSSENTGRSESGNTAPDSSLNRR